MATATKCQTPDAKFAIRVWHNGLVSARVRLPFPLDLTEEEAELLEANIHNVLELVLAPYFLENSNES